MESRSLAREIALLVLGQISDNDIQNYKSFSLEKKFLNLLKIKTYFLK